GVKAGVDEKSGACYAYGPTNIGQRKEAARRYLKENAADAIEIEDKIRGKAGLIAEEMMTGPEAEEDDA
ncbi:MAG: DNA recombination/repair protein RecA, partial [Hyphomonadaceae bacterium]